MKITKSDFGTTNTGENINIYHLENEAGAYVEVLNFGCRLVKIVFRTVTENQQMSA